MNVFLVSIKQFMSVMNEKVIVISEKDKDAVEQEFQEHHVVNYILDYDLSNFNKLKVIKL